VNGADWAVVRPRKDVAELIREERIPAWLG
jgi:hypothetical protein